VDWRWLSLILLATPGCQSFTPEGRGLGWPWNRQPTGMMTNSEEVIAKLQGNSNRTNPVSASLKSLTQVRPLGSNNKTAIEASDPLSLGYPSKPKPEFYLAMAEIAENSGEAARAAELYTGALERNPNDPQALAGAARTAASLGQDDLAIRHYERLLSSDAPPSASVHFGYGQVLRHAERRAEAQTQFERAIELAPQELRYRHELAELFVESGDGEKAVAWLAPRTDVITAHLAVATLAAQQGNTAMERFHRDAAEHAFAALPPTHPLRSQLAAHPAFRNASLAPAFSQR